MLKDRFSGKMDKGRERERAPVGLPLNHIINRMARRQIKYTRDTYVTIRGAWELQAYVVASLEAIQVGLAVGLRHAAAATSL